MNEPSPVPGLSELRTQIDDVDSRLLELLNRRAQLSLTVGKAKANVPGAKVFDPAREAQLLEGLSKKNPGPLKAEHIVSIWREIMSASRALQKPCTVAYLGPEGTFSYFAAVDYLGNSMKFVPCASFSEIYSKVYSGEYAMGVVPLENSIYGTISQSFDLFSQYPVIIQAEFYSRISHSLLSKEERMEDVHTVYSHSQPLGQCADWLAVHLPKAKLIAVESTAEAALRAGTMPGSASVGHQSTGEKLGLKCLASHIEDIKSNWTRFVLITAGKMPAKQNNRQGKEHCKSTLVFTVSDKVGALSDVLHVFTKYQINLNKLESRPLKGADWKYSFFTDVDCDLTDAAYDTLIRDLMQYCTSVRILGCYPEGPRLDSTHDTTNF